MSVAIAVVVGCDGIKSEIRKHILGHDNPAAYARYSGKFCWRGLVPMNEATALLGEELAQNQNMYLGHGAHFITFPVAKGEIMNVVPYGPDSPWDAKEWVLPATQEQIAAAYAHWGGHVQRFISLLKQTDKWALYHHDIPAKTYRKGRICVMGDAAHASTPHQGAGGGMAVEDTLVLYELLARSVVRQTWKQH